MFRLIVGAIVIGALCLYALICKIWPGFEPFGFPCVIAVVILGLHGLYWASNKNQRTTWSTTKSRVVYALTLIFIETVAMTLYFTMLKNPNG